MGDKIAVMYGGLLQQVGTPTEVYDNPRNLFVAGFIGSPSMKLLPVRREGNTLHIAGAAADHEAVDLTIAPDAQARFAGAASGADLMLGVRPEDMTLSPQSSLATLPALVYLVERLGAENIVNVQIAGHVVKIRTAPTFAARTGDVLHARIDQTRAHLFEAASGLAVSGGGQTHGGSA